MHLGTVHTFCIGTTITQCLHSSGLTAIHVATKEASIDVLKFFFQMGANKNAPVSVNV